MARVVINLEGKPSAHTLEISIVNSYAKDRYFPTNLFRFTAQKTLRASETTQVYKGQVVNDDNVPYPKPVVCKLVCGDIADVEAEATLYTSALQKVQGQLVPLFVFYAKGTIAGSGMPVAALFTVFHGKCLKGSWVDVPMMTRFKAWLVLVQLHRLGVCHNDFTPDNVVVDETGFPRVIDFGEGGLHDCDVADRLFKLYENEPSREELGCEEVYFASREMDLWTPVLCQFYGVFIDMRTKKTAQEIADQVMTPGTFYDRDELTDKAEEFLYNYYNYYILRRRSAARKQAAREELIAKKRARAERTNCELSSPTTSINSDETDPTPTHCD